MSATKPIDQIDYENVISTENLINQISKMDVSQAQQKTIQPSTMDINVQPKIVADLPAASSIEPGLVSGEVKSREVKVTHEHVVLPPLIKETVVPVVVKEIFPQVIRDIEQVEIIRRIEEFAQASVSEPKIIESKASLSTLPTTVVGPSPSSIESAKVIQQEGQVEQVIAPVQEYTIQKEPVVHERVHKKIIEEEQSKILQRTIQPTIVKETVPLHERVVEAPEVRVVKEERK